MAESEAPASSGKTNRSAGRPKKNPEFLPYQGPEELPRPDFWDKKGRPWMGTEEKKKPFKPVPRYAVENNAVVYYRVGRGGVKKRSLCTLKSSIRDKRDKSPRFYKSQELRIKLRKAGVPGA